MKGNPSLSSSRAISLCAVMELCSGTSCWMGLKPLWHSLCWTELRLPKNTDWQESWVPGRAPVLENIALQGSDQSTRFKQQMLFDLLRNDPRIPEFGSEGTFQNPGGSRGSSAKDSGGVTKAGMSSDPRSLRALGSFCRSLMLSSLAYTTLTAKWTRWLWRPCTRWFHCSKTICHLSSTC